MADTVKELFNKKFTNSEITSGTTYNFTSDANTAYVIKDIQSNQNDSATTKINATASVGLTSDFSATPSKYTDLGTIASSTVTGATGSEIMDASSTFSIRVPAQTINFKDIIHSSLAYVSNGAITEVEGGTQTVDGQADGNITPTVLTATNIGSNFALTSNAANLPGIFRQFVTNPITNVNLAISHSSDGNSQHYLNVAEFNGSTNYFSYNLGYQPPEFDGRFVYSASTNSKIRFYDTKGAASRSPSTVAHGSIDLKNAAGSTLMLGTAGSTYPKISGSYFSDIGKRYLLINPAYTTGIMLYELPDYDDSGTALAQVSSGVNVATTQAYQVQNSSWSASTGTGPNANRINPASIKNSYSNSHEREAWFIGTSAASTTKRILMFQDGNSNDLNVNLFFFIADTDYMSQTSNNNGTYTAYSVSTSELMTDFGWSGSNFNDISGKCAYISCNSMRGATGSSAKWGTESWFWLDQDVLYFTNIDTGGTGPIQAWNLKTNEMTAPITWAQYVDSSGTSLPMPATAVSNNTIGHRSFAQIPTSSQIASRTYTKSPGLQVRATAIKEDRS